MMRKSYLFVIVACLLFSACNDLPHQASSLQEDIHQQTEKANALTNNVASFLQNSQVDSLLSFIHNESDISIYIYHFNDLVYWSSNAFMLDHIPPQKAGEWFYFLTDNAHIICRWTHLSCDKQYNILTIIPIKHNYTIENKLFMNTYFPPFQVDKNISITRTRTAENPEITTSDGKYLFSLCIKDSTMSSNYPDNTEELTHSITYQLAQKHSTDLLYGDYLANSNAKIYLCIIGIFLLCFIAVIIGLFIYFKRLRNMKLWLQIATIISICFVSSYIFLFVWTMQQNIKDFRTTQEAQLEQKANYISHNLQRFFEFEANRQAKRNTTLSTLPKDSTLSASVSYTPPMHHINLDDKIVDLSELYHTDIIFYDDNGCLLSSSIPSLFTMGIMVPRINPKPFFSHEIPTITLEKIGELPYLVAYQIIQNRHGVTIGYLAIPSYISYTEIVDTIDHKLMQLSFIYLIIIFISLVLCFLFARNFALPIVTLSNQISQLKIGQYSDKISYPYHNELGGLIDKYNELVDTIAHSANVLAQAERDSAWRTMARQIAHEINNSLTPMRLSIQHLQRTKQDSQQFDKLFMTSTNNLIDQIDNLSHIAQSFSSFAKMPEVHLSEVDIAQKLTTVIHLYDTSSDNIAIRYIGPDSGIYAWTDEIQISNVFSNIIKNAMQAIANKKNGDIIIQLIDCQDSIQLSFSDNGSGIATDIQARIFEPNFTTKSTGMGLGLAIAKNIIEFSKGEISFTSNDKGTTFYITLNKQLN